MNPIVKRSLVLAVAGALLLPAGAAGAFKSGRYAGKTDRGGKVGFRVSKRKVRKFKIAASWKCSDGQAFSNKPNIGPAIRVTRRGRFRGRFPNTKYPGAGAARLKGKLRGKRARGTFSATLRFSGDTPDPKGTVLCSTGTIRWSAKRR